MFILSFGSNTYTTSSVGLNSQPISKLGQTELRSSWSFFWTKIKPLIIDAPPKFLDFFNTKMGQTLAKIQKFKLILTSNYFAKVKMNTKYWTFKQGVRPNTIVVSCQTCQMGGENSCPLSLFQIYLASHFCVEKLMLMLGKNGNWNSKNIKEYGW